MKFGILLVVREGFEFQEKLFFEQIVVILNSFFFYCTYELTFQHSLLYFLLGFSPIFFLMKTDQQVFAGFFLSFCLG